jgi:orotate phosphoribosyltransferase
MCTSLSDEAKEYDFVTTGTFEGIAFAALIAGAAEKPMFYIREEPKAYGKSRESKIGSQVEGLGNYDVIKGKKVFNVDEHLGIQPPHVKRLLSLMEADVGEYHIIKVKVGDKGDKSDYVELMIWGPKNLDDLEGKYGAHFTDLMTSGRNAREAILGLKKLGAKIDYCHFVIKRGNKDLSEHKIGIGWDLHESEIISIAHDQGLFTDADIKMLDEFNKDTRAYNEKFLRTDAGKEWIKSLGMNEGDRGRRTIVKGYPQLIKEYTEILGL